MQVAFVCCFRQGVAGMSRDLGRDVPDLENLYARKLWAEFSYPTTPLKLNPHFRHPDIIFSVLKPLASGRQSRLANASALHRGQNPQNWEKRVSGSKNSHFPMRQKRAI